ncbi:MAG TPA: hypothetical protein VNZ57_02955 [Longimicrobiales bacterium]|nr:hypothetical protein [Longimicrobiales bacterium]
MKQRDGRRQFRRARLETLDQAGFDMMVETDRPLVANGVVIEPCLAYDDRRNDDVVRFAELIPPLAGERADHRACIKQ